jgi:hypothetical protein
MTWTLQRIGEWTGLWAWCSRSERGKRLPLHCFYKIKKNIKKIPRYWLVCGGCLISRSIWEAAYEFCTKRCMKVYSFVPCNCFLLAVLQWCSWKGSCLSIVLKDVELHSHQLCNVGLKLWTIHQECLYERCVTLDTASGLLRQIQHSSWTQGS